MNFLEDKDILVTGGCGSIGSEIVRQLVDKGPKRIRVLDNNEAGHFKLNQRIPSPLIRNLLGDIRDSKRTKRAMQGVDIVFHAAALKHVSFCEYNPFEAVQTNVLGTKNVVEAAIEQNVEKLIAISTDKAVNPINTMGASKLLSERIITNAPVGESTLKSSCVRFGNVLNSSGSVLPIFYKQIEDGGPVTITDVQMTRFFMTIPQAVALTLEAARVMGGREIFVLKMKSLKIIDLAEVMIEEFAEQFGHKPGDIRTEIIGKRKGEKLYEELFTLEESFYTSEEPDMFVLRSSPYSKENQAKSEISSFNSSTVEHLSKEEIRNILKREFNRLSFEE